MACCSLLSSPSFLILQSASSAHSPTGKLFTFFASWVLYPVVGCFKEVLSLMQGTWCTGRRDGVGKPPKTGSVTHGKPMLSATLPDTTETLRTSAATEMDGYGSSGSSWAALKRWHRLWVLEIFWKAGTSRERRKLSSQVGLIPLQNHIVATYIEYGHYFVSLL